MTRPTIFSGRSPRSTDARSHQDLRLSANGSLRDRETGQPARQATERSRRRPMAAPRHTLTSRTADKESTSLASRSSVPPVSSLPWGRPRAVLSPATSSTAYHGLGSLASKMIAAFKNSAARISAKRGKIGEGVVGPTPTPRVLRATELARLRPMHPADRAEPQRRIRTDGAQLATKAA